MCRGDLWRVRLQLQPRGVYHYAIGSYHLRQTVLSGVIMRYDESFQEVFAALDALRGEGTPALRRFGRTSRHTLFGPSARVPDTHAPERQAPRSAHPSLDGQVPAMF